MARKVPYMGSAVAANINAFEFMKTKVSSILAVCSLLAATPSFAQTTYIWTNQAPAYPSTGNLGVSANWNPNGLASPNAGDILEWNGSTTGDLALTLSANLSGNSGDLGLEFYVNAAQTGKLQIGPPAGVNAGTPRANRIIIEPGAGQFSLGDNTANSLEIVWGSAFTHTLENDSSYPALVYPNIKWRCGGGGVHIFDFTGTGDWIVNSYMHSDNAGSGVQKDGAGTLYWYGTNVPTATFANTLGLTLNSGKVVLETYNLLNTVNVSLDSSGAGGTLLVYNAPLTNTSSTVGGAGNISSTISGTGPIQVNAGSLTLAGANTYTGSNYLTGGELIAFHSENLGSSGPLGVGGVISFAGGALGYSSANNYDYSPRFDTTAGQQYKLDVPSGVAVTLATALTSSGGSLTKLGGGSLTLSGANTYSGQTTVSAGSLIISGTVGSGNITVADGQNLTVVENGSQIHPSTMTLGTGAGVTLSFNNLTNTTTAPIAVSGAISVGGAITVNINSGSLNNVGATFPLLTWGSGSAPLFNSTPIVSGGVGTLAVVGNTLVLTIATTPYAWTGGTSGTWDIATSGNWKQSGSPVIWQNGALSLFDDTALGNTNVTVAGDLLPGGMTVDGDVLSYTITSSPGNFIDGTNGLTMSGNTKLTLTGGVNAYTGGTTVNGGNLSVLSVSTLANGGSPSDIGASSSSAANLVLNNGTLQYTGSGATIDRQFSVGLNGGTIDSSGSGALNLAATKDVVLVGSGSHPLKLTGANGAANTLAANLGDSAGGGVTSLTKDGANTWILVGTNTYSGVTTIHGGTLQIGNGTDSGTLGSGNTVNNGHLDFNSSGTVTVNGGISGTGSLTNDGPGKLILAGNNSYSGITLNNAGTLQIGNGGSTGILSGTSDITNNGLLVFNSTSSTLYGNGGIHGTGNVEIKSGAVKAIGNNDYTGWTLIDSGALFIANDNNSGYNSGNGILATSVITNNGTFRMDGYTTRGPMYANIVGTGKVQIGGTGGIYDNGDEILAGTNTYTGGTYIGEVHLILGDGSTPGAGSIVGDVIFTNNWEDGNDSIRRLRFNRPDNFTFSGNIVTNFSSAQNNLGIVDLDGAATITLTGTNSWGATEVNSGELIIGDGGASGTIGVGTVTLTSGNPLVINRAGTLVIPGVISSGGGVITMGSGITILGAVNTYSGATVVSNGTLVVTSGVVPGELDLEGGTYIAGGTNSVVTNTVAYGMYIDSGTLIATVNKSNPQTNTFFQVGGGINVTGGHLKLVNAGPLPVVGEKYQIFSGPTSASLPVVSPGFSVQNNLAVDGSVTVTAVQPLSLTSTVTGSGAGATLNLAWPSAWTGGVHLQVQTNTVAQGLGTNWVTVPGTEAGNTYSATLNSKNGAVFYRLTVP